MGWFANAGVDHRANPMEDEPHDFVSADTSMI
jgi:hypothetical protein